MIGPAISAHTPAGSPPAVDDSSTSRVVDPRVYFRPDLSPELDRIIGRALEKDPQDRYQHVDDMVSELRRLQRQSAKVSRSTLVHVAKVYSALGDRDKVMEGVFGRSPVRRPSQKDRTEEMISQTIDSFVQ